MLLMFNNLIGCELMINKFLGWGRKCCFSYRKVDKNIRVISYIVMLLSLFSVFEFANLLIKTKFWLAALIYSLSWMIVGMYLKFVNKYYKEHYKRGTEIFISEYSKKNSFKIEKTINVMIVSSLLIYIMLILKGKEVNFSNIREITLYITTLEVFIFIYYTLLMNFQVYFYEDYFITTFYIIKYREISELKIIKEINTSDGNLNCCEITYDNGKKGYDKLFDCELNILTNKIWDNKL